MRGGGFRLIVLLLYLIFGLYFLNYPLGLFTLPETLSNVEPWIVFIGGVLILFGGINYFRARRYPY
jgi:hypothetical protein